MSSTASQSFPAFSTESLLDGSFSSKINTYFADQFPLRNGLVGIKGVAETVLWKGENNGVLLGADGQLGVRLFTMYKSRLERTADMDFYYTENVRSAIDGVNAFADSCALPLVTLLPPRTVDVAADSFSYPTLLSDRLHEQLVSGFSPKRRSRISTAPPGPRRATNLSARTRWSCGPWGTTTISR